MATPTKPSLAVFKFASCDGCQLQLLDAQGKLLEIADRVRIDHFLEASSAVVPGPYGRPWPVDSLRGRHVIVVGGGLGLASQRTAILECARHRDHYASVTILHGAKTPAGLFYTAEYAAWRAAGIDVRPAVDSPDAAWHGHVGLVTELFADLAIDPARAAVLCCGPDPMMTAVARAAAGIGIAPRDVFVSLERNMACAVRHCGLCQFGPHFVCQDGPVFAYDRIAGYLAVRQL